MVNLNEDLHRYRNRDRDMIKMEIFMKYRSVRRAVQPGCYKGPKIGQQSSIETHIFSGRETI